MTLYLVPASRENLAVSIDREVPLELVRRYISPPDLEEIQRRAGIERVRCWAMSSAPTMRNDFDAMAPGDDVLLCETGTGYFTRYAQVTYKLEISSFGGELWPRRDGYPWERVYFLRGVQRIRAPKRAVLDDLGYPTYDLPRTTPVDDARLAEFERKLGPLREWLGVPTPLDDLVTPEASVTDTTPIDDHGPTELASLAVRRRQHEKFAARVKKNYGMACAMCDIAEREFLVAGHISAWALDEANRLNPKNGLCLCVLHDRAFERGYVVVQDDLTLALHPRLDRSSVLGRELARIEHRTLRCPAADPPDMRLLQQHREMFIPTDRAGGVNQDGRRKRRSDR